MAVSDEQTLAAQRQFALTLVRVVDRQVDIAVEAVEASAHQSLEGVEDQPQPGR